jgi:hypothetical protein
MPFPATWPPALPSGRRNIRFYQTGTLTGNFDDNAWMFVSAIQLLPTPVVAHGSTDPVSLTRPQDPSASPPEGLQPSSPLGGGVASPNVDGSAGPPATAWSGTIAVYAAAGGYVEFSFDGETVHGRVEGGTDGSRATYRNRYEGGIAVRGSGTFIVEAW